MPAELPINFDDPVENGGKIVGKRKLRDPLRIQPGEIEASREWRRWFGGVRIPKGVFRFRTHEEADEWMMRMLTRPRS